MDVLMKIPKACADCANHKCSTVCTYNWRACDGKCTVSNEHKNCNKKTCEYFVKDKTPTWIDRYLKDTEE